MLKYVEKNIKSIQELTKLLCDMRIKELRVFCFYLCRRHIKYSLATVSKQDIFANRKLFNLAQKGTMRSKDLKLKLNV